MKDLKIEVLGSGCGKCHDLFEKVKTVAKELGIIAEVFYSTDINKILALGLMSSPVLVINNTPVLAGTVPDEEKIKEIISNFKPTDIKIEQTKNESCGSCSCGGKC
jgi:small redox-active disulfide protein 2